MEKTQTELFKIFLVNLDNQTFEEVASKESHISMKDLATHCIKYKDRLKENDEWLFSASYQPLQSGYVAGERATYAEWKEEEEGEREFPFYLDIAEHDERVLFDEAVNKSKGIIYSDDLAKRLGHL